MRRDFIVYRPSPELLYYLISIFMSPLVLFIILLVAVFVLLFLVLKVKIHAFISLLLVSILTGLLAGMSPSVVLDSIQKGMGGTLGFIAVVVGLGAIFGKILEASGGAEALAIYLIGKFGEKKAPWALSLTGFIIAIPVFFDVGFIILVPIIYALTRNTRRSLLYYAIPLLAGLAATHSFIPPTPGPVAVANILGANLGWVILFGFIIGIPVVILAGPVFARYIGKRINAQIPEEHKNIGMNNIRQENYPGFGLIVFIIGVPLFLILLNTVTGILVDKHIINQGLLPEIIKFIGHPFSALIIATLLALYLLGIRRGFSRKELLDLSNASLGPAGLIILVTGAGGVLKQVLIDSGMCSTLAGTVSDLGINPVLLGWLIAAVVRVTQGSSTVAMITSAGIMAPILQSFNLAAPGVALVVIAIASGATVLSHVNDSGFWLVGKYLGLTEKQTLRSWTVMETIIALTGLFLSYLIYVLIG